MENRQVADGAIERMLGWLGFRLIRLTIWAAEQPHGGTLRANVPARAALGLVAVVGWAVDRLPGSAPRGPDRMPTGCAATLASRRG